MKIAGDKIIGISAIAAHSKVENQYRRVVPDAGNLLAQQAIADVFCVNGDSEWRGLGVIESSGVHLTPDYQRVIADLLRCRAEMCFGIESLIVRRQVYTRRFNHA